MLDLFLPGSTHLHKKGLKNYAPASAPVPAPAPAPAPAPYISPTFSPISAPEFYFLKLIPLCFLVPFPVPTYSLVNWNAKDCSFNWLGFGVCKNRISSTIYLLIFIFTNPV